MSKKNRTKKPKLTITAEGWSWLAQNTGDDWPRLLDLKGISIEAVYSFVKARTTPEAFKAFEELNLPADIVAARRKAEARQKQADEAEKLTIYNGLPEPQSVRDRQRDIVLGIGRFKPLGMVEREKAEATARAQAEGEELFLIPEAEF